MRVMAMALGSLALPAAALGHHSLAEYDRSVVQEIEGEVLRVMWSNPHIRFTLRRENEAGEEEIWDLHGFDLNSLDRRNVPHDLVAVGDVIRVAGSPSSRRAYHLYASNLLAAGGTEILISPTAEPLWSETFVGRSGAADAASADAAGRSIFRVWSRAPGVADRRHFPFTEAAVAARGAWNPDDNFAVRCEPEGMPRIMTNPHPFEFVDRGSTLALRSELYDLTRTIHMDQTVPEDQPATPLGYSVGRWEGGTLVVETTRVSWPYFDNIGTPQSDSVSYVERFTPGEDGRRLNYRLVVTDPATFTEPAVYERYWLDLGEDLQRYDCQVY